MYQIFSFFNINRNNLKMFSQAWGETFLVFGNNLDAHVVVKLCMSDK